MTASRTEDSSDGNDAARLKIKRSSKLANARGCQRWQNAAYAAGMP